MMTVGVASHRLMGGRAAGEGEGRKGVNKILLLLGCAIWWGKSEGCAQMPVAGGYAAVHTSRKAALVYGGEDVRG